MTVEEMFNKFEDEYFKFEDVENKRSEAGDIHAMLLLQEVLPCDGRMISAAEHDQIWFNVAVEKLEGLLTEGHVKELMACGVFYDDDVESLSMFR